MFNITISGNKFACDIRCNIIIYTSTRHLRYITEHFIFTLNGTREQSAESPTCLSKVKKIAF